MQDRFPRFHFHRIGLIAVVAAAAALWLSGCTINRGPFFKYDEFGNKIQFQRIPRNDEWDLAWRWSKKAYKKNTGKVHWLLSDDQKRVVAELGNPDYIRKPFWSRTNEKVEEWAYWDKRAVVQFVNRQLVYAGPIKDREEVLIRYGYPHHYIHDPLKKHLRETFIYSNDFEQRRHIFDFQDGKKVSEVWMGN